MYRLPTIVRPINETGWKEIGDNANILKINGSSSNVTETLDFELFAQESHEIAL